MCMLIDLTLYTQIFSLVLIFIVVHYMCYTILNRKNKNLKYLKISQYIILLNKLEILKNKKN